MFKGMFNGTDWAAILSTLIFFTVFVIAIILALTKKKSDVDYLARMPLDDEDDNLEQ